MDEIAGKILNELLSREKELPVRPAPRPDQPAAADHWTRPILLERAAYLARLAKYGQGSASETIKDYPQHSVMLWFRTRNSDIEVDQNFAYTLFVLEGSAALLTGGATVGMSGSGAPCQLRPGDILHISAGQPHQILVSSEKPLACLVLKVQETPAV